jgi:hypothetical protein
MNLSEFDSQEQDSDNVSSAASKEERNSSPSRAEDQPAAEPMDEETNEIDESLPPPPVLDAKENADDQPTDYKP